MRLNRRARALLHGRGLRVKAIVVASDAVGKRATVAKRLRLRAPKPARR